MPLNSDEVMTVEHCSSTRKVADVKYVAILKTKRL
jgi:hypothetical protein